VTLPPAFIDLVIALGLGLLVGLQREVSGKPSAGIRTFALVTVSGTLCAQLAGRAPWLVAAAFLGVAALAATSHYVDNRNSEASGLTTEVAFMAMFLVGVYLVLGDRILAVVTGGGIAVLLQAKGRFRTIVERLGDKDLRAIMQFALLSLVILPILPNEDFGPWGVLNLFEIWLLVVLIVGINLAGYVVYKFAGRDAGVAAGGILGGVISSTATTVSYSRRTKSLPEAAPLSAVVVMIATAIVLVRVLIEIGVVAPRLLPAMAMPIAIVLAAAIVISVVMWWRVRGDAAEIPEHGNPTMLRSALAFAAMYALVLLAVEWVRHRIGQPGVYAVAAIAGLTDVDAITLSTAKIAEDGAMAVEQAWRVILVAYLSNLLFKAGIVAVIGSRALLARVAVMFGVLFVVGAVVLMMV
jgi:uncharacterized membrane protein (DUF4010 family)